MFFDRKKSYERINYPLIIVTIALVIFGLIMLKTSTLSYSEARSSSYMKTQIFSTILGFITIFILMFTPSYIFKKFMWVIYIFCNLILVYTLYFGHEVNHSRSWLQIGSSFIFQPAEFVKIGFILCFASYLDKNKDEINNPLILLKLIVFAFLPVFLILKQPDQGTAFVFIGIIVVMFFSAGISYKYILASLAGLCIVIPIFWLRLSNYAKERILNFLDPLRDVNGTGLQAYIGKISIGSGGFFGRGLFNGMQNQTNYILVKHSDFIFAVLGEELGLMGGITLFSLYAALILIINGIAKKSNFYGRVALNGFNALFMIHIWENVGMTMGLMPITGIPLPFISHGGTFQLSNLIIIGLVLGINYYNESFRKTPGQHLNNLFN